MYLLAVGTRFGIEFGIEFSAAGARPWVSSFDQPARLSGAAGRQRRPGVTHRNGARRAACVAASPIDRDAAATEG